MISSWNQDTEEVIKEIVIISKFKELSLGILPDENQPTHYKALFSQ